MYSSHGQCEGTDWAQVRASRVGVRSGGGVHHCTPDWAYGEGALLHAGPVFDIDSRRKGC